jgi:hypothetical protein
MPGDHDPGAAILLEAPHRTKPRRQPTVITFDPVLGVAVGAMPGRWQQLLQHDWGGGCRSVMTSTGVIFVAPSARSTNRRAAAASRREETNTSMTWPNWSIARWT